MEPGSAARHIAALFPAIYQRLHATRPRGYRPTMQTLAVLLHLNQTGPLTISEMGRHLGRAQSVVSEIVKRMERRGVVTRLRDERDRRRTLVWLTPTGQQLLGRETSVLSEERLERCLAHLTARQRRLVARALRLLIEAADRERQRLRSLTKTPTKKGRTSHASSTRL
jgi:DNA-binding MarR family transcriptional regulator